LCGSVRHGGGVDQPHRTPQPAPPPARASSSTATCLAAAWWQRCLSGRSKLVDEQCCDLRASRNSRRGECQGRCHVGPHEGCPEHLPKEPGVPSAGYRIFRIQLILSSPGYCSSSPTPSSFVPAPCSSSSPIPPACYSPELHLLPYLLPDIVLVHSVLVHSVTVFHRWLLTWKSDAKGVFVVCVRVLCVYVSYFGQQPKQTGDLDPTRSRRIQSLYELRCQIKLRLSYRKDYI